MKQHGVKWFFAAAAVLCAVGVVAFRNVLGTDVSALPEPEEAVRNAIGALKADPGAWLAATQTAVRAAAVLTERGLADSAEAWFVLGVQYQREENLAGAEGMFKRTIGLKPDWSWAYCGLGSLLGRHSIGRNEEAKEALRKAIAIEPDWARPHHVLATVLRQEERFEEAEQEALTALRLDPEDIAAHNNYANLLVEQLRYAEAEEHYRTAIELNPDHPKPYYNLACLCSLLDRREEALAFLEEAFRRAPVLRADAVSDPDFAPLRKDAAFRTLVYGEDADAADTQPPSSSK